MRPCEVCGATSFRHFGDKDAHRYVRCDDCGLERIDPQPTDETLARIYGEHYYDGWGLASDAAAVEAIKRSTFRRVLRGLREPRHGKLLDCGAATGFLMAEAEALGYAPYGLELSEFGAKKIAERFGEDRAFQGELENAPFARGFFDVITMCDYLEHVREPERVLAKARDLLATRGQIALSVPHVGSLSQRTMGMRWTNYKTEHLFYFSSENLKKLLERFGFRNYRARTHIKTLNLSYMAHHFGVFQHPVLTPMFRGVDAVAPERLRHFMFPIATGDLVAYAEKA